MVTDITGRVPNPEDFETDAERGAAERALTYMGLTAGTPLEGSASTASFSVRAPTRGSRTCALPPAWCGASSRRDGPRDGGARLDEREGAGRARGTRPRVPEAGFDWRNAGCSMCLGMNPDILQSGERCASTSNRNFEGRQGRGGRTTS